MDQQMNLCLICCYSFQVKPTRYISNDARECFYMFSNQLGFPILSSSSTTVVNNSKSAKGTSATPHQSLKLPFGESITVCGDCLSLVLLYVQQRSVQREKEEHLLQLQKAVCKAINELSSVVEDVQSHIDRLHNTVRMGDDSALGEYISKCHPHMRRDRESKAKGFREKILTLNTGAGKLDSKKTRHRQASGREPIHIKKEPVIDYSDSSHSDDADDKAASLIGGDDDDYFESEIQQEVSDNFIRESRLGQPSISFSNRKQRGVPKRNYDDSWFDDSQQDFSISDGNDSSVGRKEADSTEKRKRKLSKRKGTETTISKELESGVKEDSEPGIFLSEERAAQWKDDLLSRLLENSSNNPTESISTSDILDMDVGEIISNDQEQQCEETPNQFGNAVENEATTNRLNQFQLTDGRLYFRGVFVRVYERRRMLECSLCHKMFFEERDVTSPDVKLESLMKTHILKSHCGKRGVVGVGKKGKEGPKEMSGIVEYMSCTKSRLTYKIADAKRYSYYARSLNETIGQYFGCDNRHTCSASILRKKSNGKYIQMKKGWTEDGFHETHYPEVDKVNSQIAIGKAKEMYLTDTSKTMDDICSFYFNETSGQGSMTVANLKKALFRAKYGSAALPPEEKANKGPQQCCYCGKIYKEAAGCNKHMQKVHGHEVEQKDVNMEQFNVTN